MPPYGLYPIPSQHLYGSSPQRHRPVFNTMNFKNDELPSAAQVIEEAAHVVNDMTSVECNGRSKIDKKEKRRKSADKNTVGVDKYTPVLKDKKKKKHKAPNEPHSSAKNKRKRDNEVSAMAPSPTGDVHNGDDLLGSDWLQNLKNSIGDIGALFDGKRDSKEPKRRSVGAGTVNKAQQQTNGSPVKAGKNSAEVEVPATKRRKNRDESRKSLGASNTTFVSKDQTTLLPYASTPKKSPGSLRQQSSLRTESTTGLDLKHSTLPGHDKPKSLIPETPSAKLPRETPNDWKAPIPFNLPKRAKVMTDSKKSTTASNRFVTFTTVPQPPSSTPAALSETASGTIKSSDQEAHASSNLRRYNAPLNNDSKSRLRDHGSSVSSASSTSIKDAFARMGKPSPTCSVEAIVNPFFLTPIPKSKKEAETHNEASAHTFTEKFLMSQATVNFTGEAECLRDHIAWRARSDAAGPLPCLKSATGCNAKHEEALHMAKYKNSDPRKPSVCTETEQAAFNKAVNASLEAEHFLRNAVAARTPVGLGKLDGVYTLYCPKYCATHVDKYGFGQRTLTISCPAVFESSHTYTAHLSIPPSPVACTLLAFAPPPHASFRVTTLTTSAEGYTMGLVCLGNGYVLLRVDMGLLIMGRKSQTGDGDVCMEFVGVKERDAEGRGAVEWTMEKREEMKEDSGAVEEAKMVMSLNSKGSALKETPRKKKVGRPSNAERARRAKEAEQALRKE